MAGVSFRVERGRTAALLGPNGSGKSTLLRCAVGYLAPTSGTVHIDGEEITSGRPGVRRSVGYLPENVALRTSQKASKSALSRLTTTPPPPSRRR